MEKIVVKIKIPAAGLPTHRSLHVAQLLLLVSRQILYPPGPGHDALSFSMTHSGRLFKTVDQPMCDPSASFVIYRDPLLPFAPSGSCDSPDIPSITSCGPYSGSDIPSRSFPCPYNGMEIPSLLPPPPYLTYTDEIYIDKYRTGHLLKESLHSSQLTIKDLREILCMEYPRSIYRWFKGESLPTVDHFYALHLIFNRSMEDLLWTSKYN